MAESPQIQAMRKLGFSDEEIKNVMAYDAKIDAGLDPLPLTAEQEKASGRKPFIISRRENAKRIMTSGRL